MAIENKRVTLKPFDFKEKRSDYMAGDHLLYPIAKTNGLVFMITPSISEQVTVNYSSTSLVHTNEEFNSYQNTSSRSITISDIKFPCDTPENARYALAALHFFRTYCYMDYGHKQKATGRPPSPMWLSAYGKYMFDEVPCLYMGYDFSINNAEVDMIEAQLENGEETWLPTILSFGTVSLKVQHTPNYWKNTFTLSDFKKGKLLL